MRPTALALVRLLHAYMDHVCESEGTDFLYTQDNIDYVADKADLRRGDREWFNNLVAAVHAQRK